MRNPLLFAFLVGLPLTSAQSQLPADIVAGTRIRAAVRTSTGTATYTGKVIQIRGDSVVVRTGGLADLEIFSTRDMTSLERSGGRPLNTWNAFKWSGIIGFFVGATVGVKRYNEDECLPPSSECRNEELAKGGVVGAAIGGALGVIASLILGERWEQVPLR